MDAIQFEEAQRYFADNYELVRQYPFVAKKKVRLADHANGETRRCRFCHRSAPEVTFRKTAHAVPESLGNKSIFSLNECDDCNSSLAREYEDHLAKWSLFLRSLARIRGKTSKLTFKSSEGSLRVSTSRDLTDIHVGDMSITRELMQREPPFEIALPSTSKSQPYIPVRAAMALIKVACSICPRGDLDQVQGAIDWLMGRMSCEWSRLPVLRAFTPGPLDDRVGIVGLLRRKRDIPAPFLWCLIQFANFRLQFFVPFCPADKAWFGQGREVTVPKTHYPSMVGPEWPVGKTKYWWENWSGREPVEGSATASLQVVEVGSFTPGQR